eukprot:7836567-Pyramimonas_sp.AAC.1
MIPPGQLRVGILGLGPEGSDDNSGESAADGQEGGRPLPIQLVAHGLPSAPGRARRKREFGGDLYRGDAHMRFLRVCRGKRSAEDERDQSYQDREALDNAWNDQRLREGLKVGVATEHLRPNQFDSGMVLNRAWLQILDASRIPTSPSRNDAQAR